MCGSCSGRGRGTKGRSYTGNPLLEVAGPLSVWRPACFCMFRLTARTSAVELAAQAGAARHPPLPLAMRTVDAAAAAPVPPSFRKAAMYEGASRPETGALSRRVTIMLMSRKSACSLLLGRHF